MPQRRTQRRTTFVPPMQWNNVTYTRSLIDDAQDDDSHDVLAWLIPDGTNLQKRIWVRVPLHHGIKRANTVDDLNVDVWMDAGRGIASPTSDLTGRTVHVKRFPLDAPRELEHSFTFVFTSQHTDGPNVHPVNTAMNQLVPDLPNPWRGNVLVFRHGKTAKKVLVNVEEKYWVGVTWVISAIFAAMA